ncbi:hypothetical protein PLCT2_02947 [Planctomycetaceae bacterium]|nr:hypothetical protein PLCT2_02947 [Planctomycetaceae bacterium]
MLLELTTTHQPATDLGFLLHKHPGRVHSVALAFGQAHVFYPEATPGRCTAALMLEIDPVELVRGRGRTLEDYVSERPYVASSFLSVAIARCLREALAGKSKERPELAQTAIALAARLPVLPSAGGERMLRDLFEPLGYALEIRRLPLDEKFPEWGESRFFDVTLNATCRLSDLLSHLYVLVPVLDDEKHYWVGRDEIAKLLEHGGAWLPKHPLRELIAKRYLAHQNSLARQALLQLAAADDQPDPDVVEEQHSAEEEKVEARVSLARQRTEAVLAALKASGAQSVLDLGCGEGKLLRELLHERQFARICGLDVSHRALEIASERLHFDRMAPKQRERLTLLHGSLTYRDKRLEGFDAACCIEVIEHLDLPRLGAFERVIFECARPDTVIVTTPNSEYNALFEGLPAGKLRHKDHRFEWSREEFSAWCERVSKRFGYATALSGIGPVDDKLGAPTQMGVFTHA